MRLHRLAVLILASLLLGSCAAKKQVVKDEPAPKETAAAAETAVTPEEPPPTPEPVVEKEEPRESKTFDRPVTILFAGDTMMGSSAAGKLKNQGPDSFFLGTRTFIESADLATANLEAPLGTEGEKIVEKTYTFLVDPSAAKGLKNAGFDVMTLANNHILDFGPKALFSTFDILEKEGLAYSGAGKNEAEARKPAVVKAAGRKTAILAYSLTYPLEFWAKKDSPGCAQADGYMIKEDVQKAREDGADLVFVVVHWGREKQTQLRPYQKPLAHAAIDAGADGVVGHHPHIWQGLEVYKGKPIAYSIGNFAFGSYSPSAKDSGLLRLIYDEKGAFAGASIVPLNVHNSTVQFDPKPLTGARLTDFFQNLRTLSPGVPLKLADGLIEWSAPRD